MACWRMIYHLVQDENQCSAMQSASPGMMGPPTLSPACRLLCSCAPSFWLFQLLKVFSASRVFALLFTCLFSVYLQADFSCEVPVLNLLLEFMTI